ncbi:MAG: type VI secretion system-associated FHA domain protein TagH [Rudaea sp.]
MYEISVVSYQGNPPATPMSAVFGRDGGTIGRGPANTLVLADPNRFVSRLQATLALERDRMTIANASTANPLLLNERELEAGAKAPLADGDELRIGLYVLRVREVKPSTHAAALTDETQHSRIAVPPAQREGEPSDARPSPPAPPPPAAAPLSPSVVAGVDPLALDFEAKPAPSQGAGVPSRLGPVDPLALDFEAKPAPSQGTGAPSRLGPVDPLALDFDAKPASDVQGGAVDPLAVSFGDRGRDPFADLVPSSAPMPAPPAIESVTPTHPVGPPTPPHPELPPPPSHAPASSAVPAPPGAPPVPDHVWDDLARLAPQVPASTPPAADPLPADFDPFAAPSAAARNAEDPLAEFAQRGVGLDALDRLDAPIDTIFGDTPLPDAKGESVIPDPNAAVPDPLGGPESVDPMALFGDAGARASDDAVFTRSEPDQVPELQAHFRPPAPRFAPPDPAVLAAQGAPLQDDARSDFSIIARPANRAESSAAPDASPSRDTLAEGAITSTPGPAVSPSLGLPDAGGPRGRDGDARSLLAAFFAGAGIPNAAIDEALTPEFMQRIGAMLAIAIQGAIELIAARAMLKREVKADVTIIAPTRNNPLKFLPDAESALLQMFGSRIPGFMPPVEAMEDAFRDLRAHEVGIIAGMHAALAQVLRRFEPSELEKRLKPGGMMEALLPGAHKARLWDAFAEMYVDISREAQDDFQSLFGRAFRQAYETEVSRLKGK